MKTYCTLVKTVKLSYLVPIDNLTYFGNKTRIICFHNFALHQYNSFVSVDLLRKLP